MNMNIGIVADTLEQEKIDGILDALYCTEYLKDKIGLSNIDFEQVTYSDSIMAYEYTEEGIVFKFELIPLLFESELFGWVIKKDDGKYQFSTDLIDEVRSVGIGDKSFAIIYDSNTCYMYDGSVLYSLIQISEVFDNRILLESPQELEPYSVSLNYIGGSYELQYSASVYNMRTPVYYECSVPFVSQNPPSKICWAASIASIVNYLKGTSLTAKSVAQNWYGSTIYSEYNKGLSIGLQDDVLSEYGVSYTHKSQTPSDTVLFNNIYNGYPVLGTFISGNNSYHDCVIYGINATGGYLYLMDPEYGFMGISASESSSYGWSFVSGYSGATYILFDGTCKSW